ncbi:MAG: tetratricopeptide repeat protein, partial [Proteobacteria bacterium]|nr:tetratricopeptide repeat protein [Pseudomonadota bacterium]
MTSFRPSPAQPPIQSLVALLQRGQFDALVREAKACTMRWPAAAPGWHLLGLAYLNLGRPAEAVAPLARASKLLPHEAQILEQLGIAQMQSGRAADASRSFERCLALAPGQAGVLINLAHLANDTGRHTAAERYCRQALRL